MELGELVHKLADLIWEREERMQRPIDATILSYVTDAATAELEYRRRMRDLDRRLAELEHAEETAVKS